MVVGDVTGNIDELVLGMEWNQQDQRLAFQSADGLCVKVMTDEQVELLRQQISVYAAICEKLVETHSALTQQQDLAGMRLGNLYCESLMTYAGQKITARQRWTPTPMQLQILEHMFDQGNGTPSKQKIKEISTELSQHGPISETNVYNWFQNRRARSKRKQSIGVPHNVESEAEAEVDSPKEKKTKLENIQPLEKSALRAQNVYIRSPELSAKMNYFDMQPNKGESMLPSDRGSLGSLDHSALYEGVPRMDQFIGKMEDSGSFNPYHYGEGHDIIG